jgi:hypothetical protein
LKYVVFTAVPALLGRFLLNTDSIGNQRASCLVAGSNDMQHPETYIENGWYCEAARYKSPGQE